MRRDYYAVLEVAVSSTEREIRSAFRRLARQYSPDVNLWDRQALALFQEITEAYRVLSDATTRSRYDRYGHQAFHQEREGRADRSAGAVRGDDLHLPVDLSFADAARGLSLTLELTRLSPCSQCSASGGRQGTAPESCLRCAGTGTIRTVGRSGPQPCPSCHGFGQRVADPCPTCGGRGVSPSAARVDVVIPAGVDTGVQIRVPHEGHAGPFGGPRGNLIVITRVALHPLFTRKGDNLHCEIPVTLTEAVLGARIHIPTVEGAATLVLPPGSQAGQGFRLRGKGLPKLAGEGRGDLYVMLKVLIPKGLDVRTQEMFRELEHLIPDDPRAALFTLNREAARAEA